MERKDFILREIEKISILIRYLLGKYNPPKSLEEQQNTEYLLNSELKDRYTKNLEYFINLNKTEFENELILSRGFNDENIELLADLLVKIGNNEFVETQKYLFKALELYEYIDHKSKTFSLERSNKINSLNTLI